MPNTFQYHPFPLSSGGFTTRVVRGNPIDQAALDAAVAAETGVPVDKCPLVLKSYLQRFLAAAAVGGWSRDLYDMLTFRPTSGGSQPGPDDFHTAADINADVSLSFTADAIRDWQATLALESLGVVGKVTPEVDTVLNLANGGVNQYAPGGLIEIRGENLKLDKSDNAQGVFFTPASGPEVRATTYGNIDPGSITVLVPGTLSGPLSLRVAGFINGSIRTYTYGTPLTQ